MTFLKPWIRLLTFSLLFCSAAHICNSVQETTPVFQKGLAAEKTILSTSEACLHQAMNDAGAPSFAASIYNHAIAAWNRGDLATAEICYKQALILWQRLRPETLAVARALNGLGDVEEKRGQLKAAEKRYLAALNICHNLASNGPELANSLHGLGNVALARGEFDNADKYLRKALNVRQRCCPNSLDLAKSLVYRALIARFRSDLRSAEALDRQALSIQQKLAPDSLAVAFTLTSLGTLFYYRSNYDEAERYYLQAMSIREHLSPRGLDVANSLSRLGAVAYARGDPTKAQQYYKQALEITNQLLPGSLVQAALLNSLYYIFFDRGDFDQAEEIERQALEIQERLAPNSHDVAIGMDNLAQIFAIRGYLAKSEEYERRSYAIRKHLNPVSVDVGSSLMTLGDIASERGDLPRASGYYYRALSMRQKLGSFGVAVAGTLARLGDIAIEQGSMARAEAFYIRAAHIQHRLIPASFEYATTLNGLGEISRRRGDLIKAEDFERRAFAIQQELSPESLHEAKTLYFLGNIARDRHSLSSAEIYYRQSLAITEKLAPANADHAQTIVSLATILRGKQPDEAERLYEKSLNSIETQIRYLGGSEAIRYGYRARYERNYKNYIDLLMTRSKPDIAFEVNERLRARTLLENLAIAGADIRKGVDPVLLQQERSLESSITAKRERRIRLLNGKHTDEQLAAIDKEIDGLLKQKQDVAGEIRSTSPIYAALTQPQPLSTKEVQQQLLDADTALLEYSLGAERSYVFVLNQDSVAVFELPRNAEIEAVARPVYDILTARSQVRKGETEAQQMVRLRQAEAQYAGAANKLSRMILGPIAPRLGGKRLLIVSDGILQYVPFSALPAPREEAKFVPLIADHEIVSLPSASVLQVLKQESASRPKPPREVAVLADPVFSATDERVRPTKKTVDAYSQATHEAGYSRSFSRGLLLRSAADVGIGNGRNQFPRLFFSKREADAILRHSSPGKTELAIDFRASRTTATSPELAQYRIIHFATHGLLNSTHPELSGLVLSLVDRRGRPQDGFLTLTDIYNLNLQAEMVVLSACETGLGKEIKGEGLIGITRGFMYAGASRVVASLWKVDDAATAELMEKFYEGILKEGLQPAAALRKAQMGMWGQKRWSFPYYWAGFLMQGQW